MPPPGYAHVPALLLPPCTGCINPDTDSIDPEKFVEITKSRMLFMSTCAERFCASNSVIFF